VPTDRSIGTPGRVNRPPAGSAACVRNALTSAICASSGEPLLRHWFKHSGERGPAAFRKMCGCPRHCPRTVYGWLLRGKGVIQL
jgi:hypothetical protein